MSLIQQSLSNLARAPKFPVEPLDAEKLQSGIIVRVPNWLGDAVMVLPALKVLRELIGNTVKMVILCSKSTAEMFESMAIVDEIIVLEKPHAAWSRQDCNAVRKSRIKIGFLFNNSLRDTIFMRFCGVNTLYGASARGRKILMKRAFVFPKRHHGELNMMHHLNKYLSIVQGCGAPQWDYQYPAITVQNKEAGLAPEVVQALNSDKLLLLAAGAAYGAAKRWPSEFFNEVALYHQSQGGSVAVLGGGKEKNIGDEVIDSLDPKRAFNLCGLTNFDALIELFDHSFYTVANDSGLMHLACALNAPGLAVFGPTDFIATGPASDRWQLLYNYFECSPCFKRECPKHDALCIKSITPNDVIEVLKTLDQ